MPSKTTNSRDASATAPSLTPYEMHTAWWDAKPARIREEEAAALQRRIDEALRAEQERDAQSVAEAKESFELIDCTTTVCTSDLDSENGKSALKRAEKRSLFKRIKSFFRGK